MGDVCPMFRPGFEPSEPAPPLPDDLVGEAVELFQPHYREPLTRDDGKAIVRNLTDVLLLLSEWKREDAPPEPDPTPTPLATEASGMAPAAPARRPKRRKFPAETP